MKNFILFALFAILVSCQKEDDKVVFDLIGENSVNIAEVAYSAYVPMNTNLDTRLNLVKSGLKY
jgi:hypothetical protein